MSIHVQDFLCGLRGLRSIHMILLLSASSKEKKKEIERDKGVDKRSKKKKEGKSDNWNCE